MRLAVIADIHANIYALEEVLKDIETQKVDKIICVGDLVGYATFPNEVINLIRKKEILTIQGNYDESVAEDLLACGCDYKDPKDLERAGMSLVWSQENVTPENKEWLKNLPKEYRMKIEGKDVYIVHGSPRKNNEYLYADNEAIFEILDQYSFDILICGHTHKPYFKVVDNRCIVNAGSVGKSKHGNPRATYVILDITRDSIDYISREVEYNFEKTASAIEKEPGMPSEFADLFRKGIG
ncbi:YfcE family phosphodiesterase [Anoxybacter fermentans]|uniref:Phosphoesterase n=1 Tax=Anoxybacter fermentans TaxID=1323375 RepID=A0A3Q9HQJ7_9FIRM|nr:metallophosphoesterase family protein [Anoxybacter fermentans]AZR73185.1 YfcE family phosphodiesterase [Anoxybacter fermentans]